MSGRVHPLDIYPIPWPYLHAQDVMKMAMSAMKDPNFVPPPPININGAGQAVPAVPTPNQMAQGAPEGGVITRPPKSDSTKKGE